MRLRFPITLALAAVAVSSCDCSVEPLAPTKPKMQLVEELDFGPIGEGTSVAQPVTIKNVGDGELDVSCAIGDGSSADFAIDGDTDFKIAPRDEAQVAVRFSPVGLGEDTGELLVTGNDGDGSVHLHGGPIEPQLTAPVEVDFAPADASIVAKPVVLKNSGLATLHIESTAPDAAANPQFAAPTAPFDIDLAPQDSVTFDVQYSRSARQDDGRLLVRTNDPADAAAGGVRAVTLIPDYLRQCEDGVDNDGDEIADFPNDPGCSDFHDDTEQNAAECVEGATQICGNGVCAGLRTCSAAGVFGDCDGDDTAATTETCNGVDDDCDGTRDNDVTQACTVASCPGTETCIVNGTGSFGPCVADDPSCTAALCGNGNLDPGEDCDDGGTANGDGCDSSCHNESCDPDGAWTLSAPVHYTCCALDKNFSIVDIQGNGGLATTRDSVGNVNSLTGSATCPAGTLDFSQTVLGTPGANCDETYTLSGQFVDLNTFTGSYTMQFSGPVCDCFGFGDACVSQPPFNFTATRP